MTDKKVPNGDRNAPGYSWIVPFWSWVFLILQHISIVEILRTVVPKLRVTSAFIEGYVTLNTLAAFTALAVAAHRLDVAVSWLLVVAVVYGSFRIFEITVFQANVLMFHQYRAKVAGESYTLRGFRRTVILLVHNYFEIVCWFGVVNVFLYRDSQITSLGTDPSFFSVFRESMLMMFTFTPETYQPARDPAIMAFSIQAVVGLFMSVIVLARFLALLPPPKSADEHEQE